MSIKKLISVIAIGGACLVGLARCGDYSAPSPDGGRLPDGGIPPPPPPYPPPRPYLNSPATEGQ